MSKEKPPNQSIILKSSRSKGKFSIKFRLKLIFHIIDASIVSKQNKKQVKLLKKYYNKQDSRNTREPKLTRLDVYSKYYSYH